ncbi:MAG: hypothetical protein HYV28_12450 [Ignavibacteriales bacterium]|nr:hypothetical protein [Ignavibacteriales bacterium]
MDWKKALIFAGYFKIHGLTALSEHRQPVQFTFIVELYQHRGFTVILCLTLLS